MSVAQWTSRPMNFYGRLIIALALSCVGSNVVHAKIGTTGQFSVSDTGAANYNIAIPIPPGTGGMQPQLSLTYSSQAGNGILGVGWSLSGISAIIRCPKTKASDNSSGPIAFNINDRYCLDGQRLMLKNGAYGGDGSEYRTEIESFSQIKSYGSTGAAPDGGPSYFVVKTKSGHTMWFGNWDGNSADGGIAAQGRAVIRAWALKKVQDAYGNYMKLTYINDNENGQYYPTRIDYTASDNPSNTTAANNAIHFEYEARPDAAPQYQSGSLTKNTVRLSAIRTTTDNGSTAVMSTRFSYDSSPATNRSRLITITQCGTKNGLICLKPLSVTWQGDAPAFDSVNRDFGGWNFGNPVAYQLVAGDFNGDGRTDFIELSDTRYFVMTSDGLGGFSRNQYTFPNGWNFGAPVTHQSIVGDFNGDGKIDFMEIGGSKYYTMLSNGDGTFSAPNSGVDFPIPLNFLAKVNYRTSGYVPQFNVILGDFNSDGLSDFGLLGQTENSSNNTGGLYTFLSNGDGSFRGSRTFRGNATSTTNIYPYTFDTNLDGTPDIFFSDSNLAYIASINGDGAGGFYYSGSNAGLSIQSSTPNTCTTIRGSTICYGPNVLYPSYIKTIDVNGDGIIDLIGNPTSPTCSGRGCEGYVQKVPTRVGRGNGSFYEVWSTDILDNVPYTPDLQVKGDFNGDGMEDFCYISNSSLYVFYSKGDGTFKKTISTLPNNWNFGTFGSIGSNSWQVLPGDFNGDGRTDFVVIGGGGYFLFTANGPIPDVANTITDGLGAKIQFTHSTPAKSFGEAYTPASGLTWPNSATTPVMPVLTSAKVSDGVGGWREFQYNYGGALMQLGANGRGYMGLGWIQTKDVAAGLFNRTNLRQDWPYVGLLDTTGLSTSPTNWSNMANKPDLIKRHSKQYTCIAYDAAGGVPCTASTTTAGKWFQIYPDRIDEQTWDYTGTSPGTGEFIAMPRVVTTQAQDARGNTTTIKREVTAISGETFSQLIENTYAPVDTNKWRLDQLLRSKVTNTTP